MTKQILRTAALATVLLIAGCGRGQVKIDGPPEDRDTRLGEKTSIDLPGWLTKPRSELAKLADDYDRNIDKQREGFRQSPDGMLLPKLNAPHHVPVFRRATYSDKVGFSLPDYARDGQPDAGVALHLARFGDHEAARKIAPSDPAVRKAIDAHKGEKNYPVEWSRLAGLALIAAQNKLAAGDPEGAADIALIHRQLKKSLDEKTAAGPLGAALLPAGRRALAQAAKAYGSPKWKKIALAKDIESTLAEWGKAPALPSALGASKQEAEWAIGSPARDGAVVAANVNRAADLLALPVPTESVGGIVAFLDDKDHVAQLAITYRSKLTGVYPEQDHLAYHLDENELTGKEEVKNAGLIQMGYKVGKEKFEITRSNRNPGLGAVVRIVSAKPIADHGLRTFGPVNLDRGFEANRTLWAPGIAGPTATVEDKDALQTLVSGRTLPAPAVAVIKRESGDDLVKTLRLTWPATVNSASATQLVPALAGFGPGTLESVEDKTGSYIRIRWQDAQTKVDLRLPHDGKEAELTIEDIQPAEKKPDRIKAARERDEQERTARVQAGKPAVRLRVGPGQVNDILLDKLTLGQSRAEAEAALPQGKSYRRQSWPGGASVLVLSSPDVVVPFWASQVLVRFASDKVSEIRIRYREEPASRKGTTLVDRLSEGKAGKPESLASSWVGLWPDLPARPTKPALYRWQDDKTVLTYERDAEGGEVIWRERGKEATPWRFGSQGPKGITLGDPKSKVEQTYKPATTSGEAIVYRADEKSHYEMFMVWYREDRVERVVGVHRNRPKLAGPKDTATALQQAWGRDLDGLGAVRRKEGARGDILGSFYFHDDVIRAETFVQKEGPTARVLTEWRFWPIAPARATAQR